MDELSVSSTLDAVTVYAEGAVCTRLARFELKESGAPRALRVGGLPLSAAGASLRARVVTGPTGLRVHDVRAGFDWKLPAEGDLPAEQKAVESATEALEALAARRSHVERDIQRVSQLRPSPPERLSGDPVREPKVDAMLGFAQLMDGLLARFHQEKLELERQMEDAQNELEVRRRRLGDASTARSGARAQVTRAAIVTLSSSPGSGEAVIAVEYSVPGARWTPAYELALDRSMAVGALKMRATVAQRTGEDWKDVRLSLSTADLARRVELPELRSLRIGRAQPPPPRSGWREPPPGLDELFAGYDLAQRRAPGGMPAAAPVSRAEPAFDSPEQGESLVSLRLDASTVVAGAPSAPRAAPAMSLGRALAKSGAFGGEATGGGGRTMAPPGSAPARRRAAGPASKKPAPMEAESTVELEEGERLLSEPETTDDARAAGPEQLALGALTDYERFLMAGPEGGAQRGRLALQPGEWAPDILLLTPVRVNIDILNVVAMAQRAARDGVSAELPAYARPVRASAGFFDYRYDTDHRVEIESDGAGHSVPVVTVDVGVTPVYVAVPAVEPRVYRTVRAINRSPHALLAGPADIKLGDEFLMTVPFPSVAPRGQADVGLGVEEAVKVARNTRFEESTGGLLGGATVLTHGLEIELANRLPHAAAIEVRERLPVSTEKDVRIEEVKSEPRWEEDKEPRGGAVVEGARRWRVTLEPGDKAALTAQFIVKIPADKMVIGGNRRV